MSILRIRSLAFSIIGCAALDIVALILMANWWFGGMNRELLRILSMIIPAIFPVFFINAFINSLERKNNPSNDTGTKIVMIVFVLSQVICALVFHLGLIFFALEEG